MKKQGSDWRIMFTMRAISPLLGWGRCVSEVFMVGIITQEGGKVKGEIGVGRDRKKVTTQRVLPETSVPLGT